mmetsp:Transcript_44300/g.140977  ORF Transcript_44300/g.140977 Transcript_44300/m.140977 type:complete len:253 (+) Transcript_44300:190-948(+)
MLGARYSSAYLPPEMIHRPKGGAAAVKGYAPEGSSGAPCGDTPPDYALVPASPPADLWAVGAILYQMCAEGGVPLWRADVHGDVDAGTLQKIADWGRTPTCEKKLGRIVLPRARELVRWLLRPDPAQRPQSAADVLAHPFFQEQEEGDGVSAIGGGAAAGATAERTAAMQEEDTEAGVYNVTEEPEGAEAAEAQTSPRHTSAEASPTSSLKRAGRDGLRRRPVTPSRLMDQVREESGVDREETKNSGACAVM